MKKYSNLDFWKIRSENYNKLQWVNDNTYLDTFIKAGNFKKNELVIDVGTGTGIIAHNISHLCREIIGLDKSQDMLEHSNWSNNKYFIKRDILDPIFKEETFDVVTARMVFHHILKNTQKAMNECYRILKKGGRMIFSEGVPPSKRVKKEYVEIFKLKEERLIFYEEDLVTLMERAGFKNINLSTCILKNVSVVNWLVNSGLPEKIQNKIYEIHVNSTKAFKEDYEMKIVLGDCLINMKMLILVGYK